MSTAESWEAVVERITATGPDALAWRDAFLAVPRAGFVPTTIWQADPGGTGDVAITETDDPVRWQELVGSDSYVVTQVDDGATPPTAPRRAVSSTTPHSCGCGPSASATGYPASQITPT